MIFGINNSEEKINVKEIRKELGPSIAKSNEIYKEGMARKESFAQEFNRIL